MLGKGSEERSSEAREGGQPQGGRLGLSPGCVRLWLTADFGHAGRGLHLNRLDALHSDLGQVLAREIPSILPPAYWVTTEKSLSLSGSQTLPLTSGGIATAVSKLFFLSSRTLLSTTIWTNHSNTTLIETENGQLPFPSPLHSFWGPYITPRLHRAQIENPCFRWPLPVLGQHLWRWEPLFNFETSHWPHPEG